MNSHLESSFVKKTPSKAWTILALVILPYSLSMFARSAPSVISMDLAKDFAVQVTDISIISAATMIAYGFIQIPAGLMADALGGRYTICLFLLAFGTANIWFGLSNNLASATAARFAVGLSAASFVPAMTIIARWFSPQKFGFANGLMIMGGNVGIMCASAPLVYLCGLFGWRGVMYGTGLLCMATSILIYLVVHDAPPTPLASRRETKKLSFWQGIKQVAGVRSFWPLCIAFCCTIGVFFSLSTLWIGPFLIQGCGISKELTGMILLVCAATSLFATPALAAISDKLRTRRKIIMTCLAVMVISMVLIALLVGHVSVWPLVCFYCVFLLACGSSSLFFTAAKEMFPVEICGTVIGFLNVLPYFCTAILQKLFAIVLVWRLESREGDVSMAYGDTFFVNVLLVLIAFIASVGIKETFTKAS